MQIIKGWVITVIFPNEKVFRFIIHDNFYSNMLRKLAEISFDQEPRSIEIREKGNEINAQVT